MRYSFLAFWLLGLFCFISLIVSVGRDFKSSSIINDEPISLINPGVQKLEVVAPNKNYYNNSWFRLDPFSNIDDDSAYVDNVRVRIIKSTNDSFKVTIRKMSNGESRTAANNLASLIQYHVSQNDSILNIDRAIPINTTDKFRNQRVVVTIAVPVGKQIKINRSVGWGYGVHFNGPWNNNGWYDDDWDTEEHGWNLGVVYIMKADGLYTLSGKPADRNIHRNVVNDEDQNNDDEDNSNTTTGGYRYDQTQKTFDSVKKF